jgi:hypothetical protein
MLEDLASSSASNRRGTRDGLNIAAILLLVCCGLWPTPAGAWTESARQGTVGEVKLRDPEGSCNYQAPSGHVFAKVWKPSLTGAPDVVGDQVAVLQAVATDEYRNQIKSKYYGPYTVRSNQWVTAPDLSLGFPSDNRTRTIALFVVWEARNQEGHWKAIGGRALTLDRIAHLPYQGERTYANC